MNKPLKPKAFMLKQQEGVMAAGVKVYECLVHDYGMARDDTNLSGIQHVSVTLDPNGGWPTFTVPEENLLLVAEPTEADPATIQHAISHVVNAVLGPSTTAVQLENLLSGMGGASDVADVLLFFRKLGMLESSAKEAVRRLVHKPIRE